MDVANIVVEPCSVTWNDEDMGFIDGDVEVTMEEQAVDVTAHQTGTSVIDAIRTGKTAEISLTLKETSLERLKALLMVGGDEETINPTVKLTGWGTSKDFRNMSADAAPLILHPMALADTDKTRDLMFWKAYPQISSMTISGENPRTIALTFRIFPDLTRDKGTQLFAIGDHTAVPA